MFDFTQGFEGSYSCDEVLCLHFGSAGGRTVEYYKPYRVEGGTGVDSAQFKAQTWGGGKGDWSGTEVRSDYNAYSTAVGRSVTTENSIHS
jgi:hypothetical protein